MTKTITVAPNNSETEVTIEQTIATTPEPTEILGVKVETGLSWYWEGAIIIAVLATIYVGKKAIDKIFRNKK